MRVRQELVLHSGFVIPAGTLTCQGHFGAGSVDVIRALHNSFAITKRGGTSIQGVSSDSSDTLDEIRKVTGRYTRRLEWDLVMKEGLVDENDI